MTDALADPVTSRTATEPSDSGGPPWRSGVGLIILNMAGKTLLCESAIHGGWQWPQGGRDEGETPLQAAWRELHEETGLQSGQAELLAHLPARTEYDFPDYIHARHRELDGEAYVQKYRGQRHDWFVFRLTAADSAIDFTRHHEIEFRAFRWATVAEASAAITGFKRPVYLEAIAMLEAWLAGRANA